jgi:hypothetical protein
VVATAAGFFRALAPAGAISFALYATSRPIETYFVQATQGMQGGPGLFAGCMTNVGSNRRSGRR